MSLDKSIQESLLEFQKHPITLYEKEFTNAEDKNYQTKFKWKRKSATKYID